MTMQGTDYLQVAAGPDPAAVLETFLIYGSCVRSVKPRGHKDERHHYKRGLELRITARGKAQLQLLISTMHQLNIHVGSPYVKHQSYVLPVYGKDALNAILRFSRQTEAISKVHDDGTVDSIAYRRALIARDISGDCSVLAFPWPKRHNDGSAAAIAYYRAVIAGDLIRERTRLSLSPAALARLAGISRGTLDRIERMEASATTRILDRIDRALRSGGL